MAFLTSSPLLRHSHPSPFLHGSCVLHPTLLKTPPPASPLPTATATFSIQAMKKLQGRVVCSTNDKTVAVEVVRLAPHPKYKRRVRKRKTYQAHDPDNKFAVGDFVQLEKCRPISKLKCFLALPVLSRNAPKSVQAVPASFLKMPPFQTLQESDDNTVAGENADDVEEQQGDE